MTDDGRVPTRKKIRIDPEFMLPGASSVSLSVREGLNPWGTQSDCISGVRWISRVLGIGVRGGKNPEGLAGAFIF